MNIKIKKLFLEVLINSLNSAQINYLGERLDSKFNVYKVSGFGPNIPLPKQTAAETLLRYFNTDEEVIRLFTYMLRQEDKRFYNRTLKIWGKVELINLLYKYKWIYDEHLIQFFLDPFYEHEINFFEIIKIIDLRYEVPVKEIIDAISKVCEKMSILDLEWRITLRLYDLERDTGELIRKIIELLLVRQNLKSFQFELFTCLKELIINASKANYKLLFEKFHTRKQGVTTHTDYFHFLRLFKSEIEEYGNKRLLELAKKEDRFINVTFQSTNDSIEMWVTNNENISLIEKQGLLNKLGESGPEDDKSSYNNTGEEEYTEGAGLGINLVLNILKKYSKDKKPLKAIFYPNFIKIGFSLKRKEMLDARNK